MASFCEMPMTRVRMRARLLFEHTLNNIIQSDNVRWNSFECKFHKIILATQCLVVIHPPAHRHQRQHQPEDQIIIYNSFFPFSFSNTFKCLHHSFDTCAFDASARWIFHSNTLLLPIDLYHITLDRRRGWFAARLTILFANQWLNKFELCSTSRTTCTDGDGVGTIHMLHSCAQLHIHSKSIYLLFFFYFGAGFSLIPHIHTHTESTLPVRCAKHLPSQFGSLD